MCGLPSIKLFILKVIVNNGYQNGFNVIAFVVYPIKYQHYFNKSYVFNYQLMKF